MMSPISHYFKCSQLFLHGILEAFGHLFDVSLHEIQCHQEPINGARWNTVLPVADVPEVFAVLHTGGMLCMSIALAMFMIV